MKNLILCFLFSAVLQNGFTQKVYFVYLQTEQEQPFFVKMNDKVLSSTASGYLLLSNLYDSTYSFSVGFPQNKWPEQKFSVKMGSKDHGYQLKNFGEKGWGLFDLQTFTVQMGEITNVKNNNIAATSNISSFKETLAKAIDDSTLNQKPVIQKSEIKKTDDVVQNIEKKEETKNVSDQPVSKVDSSKNEAVWDVEKRNEAKSSLSVDYKRSVVTRKSESSTKKGFRLVYIDDDGNGLKDTIRILIPDASHEVGKVKQEPKENIKFLDISTDTNKSGSLGLRTQNTYQTQNKPIAIDTTLTGAARKNSCITTATDSDFFELRKNMAAVNGDDEMIKTAKKYFETRCFTTAQLKNLSALFLGDAGKYKFFETAYSYISDRENFNSLQAELKDENYINRFKALSRN